MPIENVLFTVKFFQKQRTNSANENHWPLANFFKYLLSNFFNNVFRNKSHKVKQNFKVSAKTPCNKVPINYFICVLSSPGVASVKNRLLPFTGPHKLTFLSLYIFFPSKFVRKNELSSSLIPDRRRISQNVPKRSLSCSVTDPFFFCISCHFSFNLLTIAMLITTVQCSDLSLDFLARFFLFIQKGDQPDAKYCTGIFSPKTTQNPLPLCHKIHMQVTLWIVTPKYIHAWLHA